MTIKVILKYIVLPVVVILLIVFLAFHKNIIRSITFDHYFDKMVKHYGRIVVVDYGKKIVAMGKDAEGPLIEKVRSPGSSDVEKRLSLLLLGMMKSDQGLSLIVENLKSPNADLRLGAIQGLKYNMKAEYVSHLTLLIDDPVDLIRENMVSSLGSVNSPESIALLKEMIRKERIRSIWYRAWQSLRYLLQVDGIVEEKFRMDKDLNIIPEDEANSEVLFTYYFLKIREGETEKIINVSWMNWRHIKVGDHIIKKSKSDEFTITHSPVSQS